MHDSSNYPKGAVNYPWHMDSRNKRSIVLDLKKPDARAALDRLIALSDVLICNFPPLVRDKLKLGYDDVKRVNPKLVYASLTGYGESGPRPRPAGLRRHRLLRPVWPSGRATLRRRAARRAGAGAGRSRDRHGARLGDPDGADAAHEDRRGLVGRHVAPGQRPVVVRCRRPGRPGRRLPAAPPAARPAPLGPGQHLSHSDDRWLQLTIVREDKMWPGVCATIGRPELENDPRFATVEARRKNSAALAAILHDAFATRDYEHWRATMAGHGITFGVISRPQDVPRRPAGRGERLGRRHGDSGDAAHALPIPSVSASPSSRWRGRRRRSGQHSDEILAEAGLTSDEIAALHKSGAVP
jgi:formyl-CoA transferase